MASDDVWILGITMTKFGKHRDKDVIDLATEATTAAPLASAPWTSLPLWSRMPCAGFLVSATSNRAPWQVVMTPVSPTWPPDSA